MEWIQTPDSSNIAGFGYVENSQVLKVEFKNGGTYDYFDVPLVEFQSMKAADSRGKYLAQHIKGRYRYAKV